MIQASNETYPKLFRFEDNDEWFTPDELKFHSNWNWLMPVIQRCNNKGIWHSGFTNQLHDGLLNQNIIDCWEACSEFIKYNNK